MSLLRNVCRGAVLLVVLASPAGAQTALTGAVRGTVRSAGGEALGDALVTLVESRSGIRYQTITSRSGDYRLPRLPAGEYAAIAEQIGYAPLYLTGVPVRPGLELELPLALRAGDPAALKVDSASFAAGTASLGRAAAARWLGSGLLRSVPRAGPDLADAFGVVSWLDRDLGAEGLPGAFSAFALDGHPFREVAHPLVGPGGSLLPAEAATAVEITRGAVDGEWSTPSGALFSAFARRGVEGLAGDLSAAASAGPLAEAGFFDVASGSPRYLRGAGVVEGSAFADSARFAVGGSFRSDDVPFSPAWPTTADNQAVAAAGAWIGRLDANFQPQLLKRESFSGFGQLDWRIASGQRLGVTLVASKPADRPAAAPGSGAMALVEGQDLLAGLSLFTDLGSVGNQVRLSWASSTRESFGTAPTAIGIMVPGGLRLNGSEPARFEESTVRIMDALHLGSGNHGFKLGAELAVSSHDQAWRRGAVAEVLFGGTTQLQQSTGIFRQARGASPNASWTGQVLGFFAEDSWRAESGVNITAVVRAERQSISDVPARDAEWFRLTGIANDTAPGTAWRLSPRLDVSWATGEHRDFVVNASAGLYHDRVDPVLVGEWLVDNGTAQVDRAAGNVGVWTVSRPAGATTRTRLTLPGTALRGPETLRASGGFAFAVGDGATLAFDAGYRHTRFLPGRRDMNLVPAASADDQYGRPVFGTLVKQGALVAGLPGTNRLFPEYDEVTALDFNAWSTWYGGTVRLETSPASALQLGASYTYSRTRDNWFGALAGGGVGEVQPSLGLGGNWSEGVSDFDVPNRAAVFAAWTSPVGLKVSGLARYQSGRPFTPGFPLAVDVNGDGIGGNDPAFVDPAVAGLDQLIAGRDCLRRASGAMVERNACRADATFTVDGRAEFGLVGVGQGKLAVTAELIDLLETDFSPVDAALYRIDPAGSLVINTAARSVTVPLLANPGFGEPLALPRAGRSIRLGLALTW